MLDVMDIERSVKRRLKSAKAKGPVTVIKTGEPSRDRIQRVEPPLTEYEWRQVKTGRMRMDKPIEGTGYWVGGIKKATYRTANVIRDGKHLTVINPNIWKGDEIVNGMSDTITRPKRVQRRSRKGKSGGGRKGAMGVLR